MALMLDQLRLEAAYEFVDPLRRQQPVLQSG